ncbi:Hus1-like protein [Zalerion maritima]|uniref:Checkpoint protein n=1 Tax=Zalerion maritima TaxID=339359 RepID=A0AAD5RNI0_9PEZI|nr:Hus1-like protein [Zalerion maritima]
MRFKTELKDIRTFSRIVTSISSLEKIAWVRLDDEVARFTVIPDVGSQVWASINMDLIFSNYIIQSAEEHNTINLEIPLIPLQRALKSAIGSTSATLRLTKKDGIPVLSTTITTNMVTTTSGGPSAAQSRYANIAARGVPSVGRLNDAQRQAAGMADDGWRDDDYSSTTAENLEMTLRREREKIITQDFPVRVLHPETVETVMQPKVREADVNINLPSLLQLKAISDRFTKLAGSSTSSRAAGGGGIAGGAGGDNHPKLELSATMHGRLNLRMQTPEMEIESTWSGLEHPFLDEAQLDVPLEEHPSEVFRRLGPDKWATVRVDGRDWSRVLSVGRLNAARVVACFCDGHALILYVYLPVDGQFDSGNVSCLTVSLAPGSSNEAIHYAVC